MKVLQITNYISPVVGGIGRVSEDVLHFLRLQGAEQRLICFNTGLTSGGNAEKCHRDVCEQFDGVEITRCGTIAKIFSQSVSFSLALRLHRCLRDFRPDTVVFHYPNPLAAFFLLREKKTFKLVLWWHSDIVKNPLLCRLLHRQNLRLIRRADVIVGATPSHLNNSEYSAAFSEEKKMIVPYTVGQWRIREPQCPSDLIKEIHSRYEGKILCFFIGRHVPYKGLEFLIDAARRMDEHFAFAIAGSGPLTSSLKERAAGDAKIEFVGVLSEQEKMAYMTTCDVFCFPSITKNENFGIALAEAMYCGKPAITFEIPDSGVGLVNVNGETGFACPNRDVDAYARALSSMADNELRLQMGRNAREHILRNYSDDCFESGLRKLFRMETERQPVL